MHQIRIALLTLLAVRLIAAAAPNSVELTTSLAIDVDGAPSAYGPSGKPALDFELNAHRGAKATGEIVGYLTKNDGRTPEVQGPHDPYPGYYISTTAFQDKSNPNRLDPRKYVDASKINYVVLGVFAAQNGAKLGDFVAVHSTKTGKSVFGIIGDTGNSSGAEGSLALLQALRYPVKDGKAGGVESKEIVIRYFPKSNPDAHFFRSQAQIDQEAEALGLSKDFVTFRNGLVAVTDIVLPPGETQNWTGSHPSVTVWLTDATLEMRQVKRGAAIFAPAAPASIKNTGSSTVHFAHIEFLGNGKPETWGSTGLSPNYVVLLENQYTRVYDIHIPAGTKEPQHTHHDRVVVCLEGATLKHLMPDGREEPSTLKTGEIVWRRGGTHIGQNLGKTDLWVIAVEPK